MLISGGDISLYTRYSYSAHWRKYSNDMVFFPSSCFSFFRQLRNLHFSLSVCFFLVFHWKNTRLSNHRRNSSRGFDGNAEKIPLDKLDWEILSHFSFDMNGAQLSVECKKSLSQIYSTRKICLYPEYSYNWNCFFHFLFFFVKQNQICIWVVSVFLLSSSEILNGKLSDRILKTWIEWKSLEYLYFNCFLLWFCFLLSQQSNIG